MNKRFSPPINGIRLFYFQGRLFSCVKLTIFLLVAKEKHNNKDDVKVRSPLTNRRAGWTILTNERLAGLYLVAVAERGSASCLVLPLAPLCKVRGDN